MKLDEALKEIKSRNKWYAIPGDPEGYKLRTYMFRAENGKLKHDTLRWFLSQFGYDLEVVFKIKKHT